MQTTFQVKDATKYQQFAVPHVLFCDKERGIQWAALLKPAGLSVYLALRHHANYQSRRAWPSEKLLADETGLSARHVRRIILQLLSMGMILRFTAKEKIVTNVYTITNPSKWHLPKDDANAMSDDATTDEDEKEGVYTNAPQKMFDLSPHEDKSNNAPMSEMSSREDTGVLTCGHPCPHVRTPMSSKIDPKYIYPSISTAATTTPADASCADAADFVQDAAAVVVENINSVFEGKKRFERITLHHVKQICQQHQLTDATEILKAVNVLAGDANIRNIIGVLIGKKNAAGKHESICFEGGACILEGGGATVTPPVIDAEPGSTWAHILTMLAGRVNPSSFNTWVRPCQLSSEHPDRLNIAVPSETHKYWLELHYKKLMQDEFKALRGGRGAVEFIVHAPD